MSRDAEFRPAMRGHYGAPGDASSPAASAAEAAREPSRWERSPLFGQPSRHGDDREASLLAVARLVEEEDAFLARERAESDERATYRLRESKRPVVIRHGTKDLGVLDEVFVRHLYGLPAPVSAKLSVLGRPARVVDLGANVGLAAVYLLDRLGSAELTCVEPDTYNLASLEACAAANDDAAWRILAGCAGGAEREVAFVHGEGSASQIAEPDAENASTARVLDVLPLLRDADLLKLDAEGGEWEVLGDSRFAEAGVPALVLEYHAHLCPEPRPRSHVESLLGGMGYRIEHLFERPDGDVGMLWAWRD